MARPVPSSVITLIEKTETSVKPVIRRTTASAPSTAIAPTTAGISAATTEPKISSDRMITSGIDTVSAWARSSLTVSLTSL